MMQRVILNPHARGGRAQRLRAPVLQWLEQRGIGDVLCVPDTVEQARDCVRQLEPGSRVVVIGGDGTLNQLLGVLLAGRHAVGLVPYGSGNDVARALGLNRKHWQQALSHALQAQASPVDVGWARFFHAASPVGESCDVPFLSSLTSGFDSSVGYRALHGPRWLSGLPRYLLATLRELAHLRRWEMRVVADGQMLHGGQALFASTLNTPTFGSGMPAVPGARPDDGELNLLLAGAFGLWGTAAMLPRLLLGKHLSHPKVQTRGFSQLHIQSVEPLPLAADGEFLGEAKEVWIHVTPGGLPFVCAGPQN